MSNGCRAVAVLISFGSYLWGSWSALFEVLIVLTALDYITGLIASGIDGKINSRTGLAGIARKSLMFFIIAVAHQADVALGTGNIVRDCATLFYAVNEAISVIENSGRAGVPVPDKMMKALEVLRESEYKRKRTKEGE